LAQGSSHAEKYYSGDHAYSLTKLLRAGWGAIGSSADEGAKRIFYLAHSAKLKNSNGKYFMNDLPIRSAAISYNKSIREKLWNLSLNYANKRY